MVTRLMSRLFSATEERDAELTEQVGKDIEDAKKNGVVDTEELKFEDKGDGIVAITDKENGEITMAEKNQEGQYELFPAEQSEQIEGFIHPEGDGVTPGKQVGAPDEHAEDHMTGEDVISPNKVDGGLNPEAGHEKRVDDSQKPAEEACPECGKNPCECEHDEEEKKFSVSSNNAAVIRIFSDQVFCERIFSEVIETEETAKVGDLKVEKCEDEDNAVIVTSESTGDQAKVVLDDENMEVTELESKQFGEDACAAADDAAMACRVVGIDVDNHVLVDSPVYDEQAAQDLVNRLNELGIQGVEVFHSDDEAREYAADLLDQLGVESDDDIEEPEEATFSDTDEYTLYTTKFFSNQIYADDAQTKFFSENEPMTNYMVRLFSEEADQEVIESAVAQGIPLATENETIVPIDEDSAIVEDRENGELTLAVINEDHIEVNPIDEEDAKRLIESSNTPQPEEEEKEFSDVYTNEAQTKFFSENEPMTNYMVRLFSDAADQDKIEEALESGEKVETENEIIVPVDEETVVVEDKENGEFTKAVVDDEDIEVVPISKKEAKELLPVEEAAEMAEELEEAEEDEEDKEEEGVEEKEFSNVYTNEAQTKFFSLGEPMTNYMVRLFSEEADQDEIEKAIESGEEVENDSEVITPVDEKTAVIEDKENNEFTKAELSDDEVELHPISEEEAEELKKNKKDEDEKEEHKEEEVKAEEEEEKKFADPMSKFFAEVSGPAAEPKVVEFVVDENGNPVHPVNKENEEEATPVEAIEDKALAAVQSIQAAANEAQAQILNAKAAPAENGADLQEATFSEKEEASVNDPFVSWLKGNIKK